MGTSELTSLLSPEEALAEARARFADSLDATHVEPRLGSIVLRPDQIDTVRRVRDMLRCEGGCLLADDVGTGKTYVALAVAREWRRPLVVVPASLRSTWTGALRRAGISCALVTHESLSRGAFPDEPFDGLIVDESHRFRSTSRRHATLARLAWRSPLLLLSATPLQNRASELAAQIALFLGEVAYSLDAATLTRWTVRGAAEHACTMVALPRVIPPRWLEVDVDDGEVLDALLALPPPPRAADVGDGGTLLLLSLVRAWASSRAALQATIQRRTRSLIALEQCCAAGRLPTRRELASWAGTDAVQLGFAALLAGLANDRVLRGLTEALAVERRTLEVVRLAIARDHDADAARARALRDVRTRHPGAAVLAFSEFATTVRAYFTAMHADAGIGMLTAGESRIASGRLSREALLARFAPLAQGAPEPHARERVTLLLATDLLSEGVNLQDASVVAHLDLPWNPARLAQRVGRVRRPGGAREVTSYLVAPPARTELLLRAEARLRSKLVQAERTIGRGLDVMPKLSVNAFDSASDMGRPATQTPAAPGLSVAELRGEIYRTLESWRRMGSPGASRDLDIVVVALRSPLEGWLAVLDDGRIVCGVAPDGTSPASDVDVSDDVAVVGRVLCHASVRSPEPSEIDPVREAEVLMALQRWIAADWTRRSCAIGVAASPLRRRVQQRLETLLACVPRHRRVEALSLAGTLRAALSRPMPLGAERALSAQCDVNADQPMPGLLRAVRLVSAARGQTPANVALDRPARPRAMLLLGEGRASTSDHTSMRSNA